MVDDIKAGSSGAVDTGVVGAGKKGKKSLEEQEASLEDVMAATSGAQASKGGKGKGKAKKRG